jgi:hypothetical protein
VWNFTTNGGSLIGSYSDVDGAGGGLSGTLTGDKLDIKTDAGTATGTILATQQQASTPADLGPARPAKRLAKRLAKRGVLRFDDAGTRGRERRELESSLPQTARFCCAPLPRHNHRPVSPAPAFQLA